MRVALAVGLAGCAVPPPFAALETASTLPSHAVLLEAGAGGGVGTDKGPTTVGGFARARYGLGDHQELGVDAAALFDASGNAVSGKLVYKNGPWPHVALEAGIGGTIASSSSLGADVAVIASAADGDGLVPYAAVRFSGAVPSNFSLDTRAATELVTIPIGVAQRLTKTLRGFVEVGGLGSLAELQATPTSHAFGFYGALAIGWQQ